MDAFDVAKPARSVTSVDLGAMKTRVAELSAAAGVGPSTWLRDLVHREISRGESERAEADSDGQAAHGHGAYRTWLDAGLTAKLDRLTEANGFRTRPAALRALLEGVQVAGRGGAATDQAVHALGVSNHRLVAIGRNVNQIAKVLNAGGTVLTVDRMALEEAVGAIHKHVEVAAALVSELRFGMLWTMLFSYPLMVSIQLISARIGRVTGHGIAGNLRRHYPRWLLLPLVALLVVANTINIGADLGAMGAALHLLVGGNTVFYTLAFGMVSLLLQVFIPYRRYVRVLKWLTLAIFAYVGTAFAVAIPWGEVLLRTLVPQIALSPDYIIAAVAVLGTTISPYLFFWQASQEVEELGAVAADKPLKRAPEQAAVQLERMGIDTYVGMAMSNVVAFFIILTTAVTLHRHGVHDIETAAQAAEALRPVAGAFAFFLFAAGIVGTGLLAVPVLAGSAAYGVGETMAWRVGLENKPSRAKGFYAVIVVATLAGVAMNFSSINPVKALFWTAVINGVIAVPIIIVIMLMVGQRAVMGDFVVSLRLKTMGWLTAFVMALCVAAMFATWPMQ